MTARTSLGLAVLAVAWLPTLAAAQSGPALSPEEQEAQQMGLEMAFACSPRRHGEATGSASTIRRGADALAGTAVYFESIEGTFVALEEYDEALDGHCLVFGWWGDELAPGTYPVARLSMRAMEEEEMSGEHSFFSWAAERATGGMTMIVVESGTVTIDAIGPGSITGSFEITGFALQGDTRGETVRWAGTFNGVEGEAL